jgi:NADH-quinone oxidoreductase subunit L
MLDWHWLDWFWLIPLIPLASSAVTGLLGPRAPKAAVNAVAVGGPGLALVLALGTIWEYLGHAPEPVIQTLYSWTAGPIEIPVAFLLDPLSAVMLFVVTFVGFWIHVYSIGYMGHEPAPYTRSYQRFFAYMNLFMAAMLFLVLGDNLVVTFVGWEGVGLCSYLLIGFYYQDDDRVPPEAGRKAFIVNRIGDFAFLIGMFTLFSVFGTLRYTELLNPGNVERFSQPYALGLTLAAFVTLCLFGGAVGKSAQIPLYVWLPDAMAGPTPVSALIHAATMVTAGVYIVVRTNLLYQLAGNVSLLVAGIGTATAIFAATMALTQTDLKKVLAYSTVSQLGYMFLAAGVGAYTAAIFHLFTHAFFKALLFLGAGSVIHAMGGEQDIRKMGGLRKYLPVTWGTFLVGSAALAGLPLFSGFFSKDEILAGAASGGHWVLWTVGFLTAVLTAVYTFRMTSLTFHGGFRGTRDQREHLHESPAVMTVPLAILAVGALGAGYVGVSKILAFGGDINWFHHWLEPVIASVSAHGESLAQGAEEVTHHLSGGTEWLLILLTGGLALAGAGAAGWAYAKYTTAPDDAFAYFASRVYSLLHHKYWVDEIYDAVIVRPLRRLADFFWRFVDGILIEGAIRVGTVLTELVGEFGRSSTTGNVRDYLLYVFLGILGIYVLLQWVFV